MIIVMSI